MYYLTITKDSKSIIRRVLIIHNLGKSFATSIIHGTVKEVVLHNKYNDHYRVFNIGEIYYLYEHEILDQDENLESLKERVYLNLL